MCVLSLCAKNSHGPTTHGRNVTKYRASLSQLCLCWSQLRPHSPFEPELMWNTKRRQWYCKKHEWPRSSIMSCSLVPLPCISQPLTLKIMTLKKREGWGNSQFLFLLSFFPHGQSEDCFMQYFQILLRTRSISCMTYKKGTVSFQWFCLRDKLDNVHRNDKVCANN
jgi:hypothetical protein